VSRKTIGIVDYGVGNHASVQRAFQSLGHSCRLSDRKDFLATVDVMVLPGVGAFPAAMQALHNLDLVDFIRGQAVEGQVIIGLCLGMQLLAEKSLEHKCTDGLGLIPGIVQPLQNSACHVGWNTLEILHHDSLLMPSNQMSVYFNHSYVFQTQDFYQAARVSLDGFSYTAAVRKANVCGLQFHPEKSQTVGKQLLSRLVEGLGNAK
jgi:imidazole glycerol phosphate synthase glutamine amidotransferase subunit